MTLEKLLSFIQSRDWAIDFNFGLSQLSTVLLNMELGKIERPEIVSNSINVEGATSSNETSKHIKVLSLTGAMFTEDQACSYGIRSLTKELYKAYNDTNVLGILIEGNTGGGESTSGHLLNSAIKDKNKPVVIHAQMLASAGIMGTLNATEIVADGEAAQFGSIGSYISIDTNVAKWLAENIDDLYAEQSTNKNYEIREYLKGNKVPLQNYVNKNAQHFIDAVTPKLKGNDAVKQTTVSGGMFYAQDAKRRGLVDSIGGRNYAINRIIQHSKY